MVAIPDATADAPTGTPIAFAYQTVTPTTNDIRIGLSYDGQAVDAYMVDILNYTKGSIVAYGDPVFSYLSNGNWAMTSWSGMEDTHGSNMLMYHEAACPKVVPANVKVLTPSTAAGCRSSRNTTDAKTSQVFEANGSNYILHTIGGELHMTRLTDSTHKATDLQTLCIRSTAATSLADLKWGESTMIISKAASGGLLMSDSGITKRKDGTWVVFVKGIPENNTCGALGTCQLCSRAIYRTTSTDLINWTTPEKMIEKASVPDTTTFPDGTVWVYWDDFTETCAADNMQLAERAPMSGAYELSDLSLSPRVKVTIPKEPFESDVKLHYATNPNPIAIGSIAAKQALDACVK